MEYENILRNNLLIIIYDDRKYNKNLIKNFVIGYNSYPDIKFSSGLWNEYFNKDYKNLDDNFLEFKIAPCNQSLAFLIGLIQFL